MKVKIEYLKDRVGNNYIGVNIYSDAVYKYLEQLKGLLGDEYETYVTNQQNRDHGKHHITVINLIEYTERVKTIGMDKFINSLEKQFHNDFDVTLMGLGTAEKNGNRTYFIVVKSDDLNELRKVIGLGEYDFHITLGFKWKDVFGVRKNVVMELKEPFLKLLKQEYYKNNENFNFVKSLQNFDGDVNSEVEPIKIEDTYATFRIGEYKYFTVSLIKDSLMITAKWQDQKSIPILSNTIIYRKIKNI
jgi:hypothetical protein